MPIKNTIFFDLDGTLINSMPDLLAALNVLLTSHQISPISKEKAKECFQYPSSAIVKKLFSNVQCNLKTLVEKFFNLYEARMTEETTLYPGVESVLQYLDDEKIPWGVVTNKPYFLAEPLLRHFNLIDRSICLVCPETVERPKPYPDPLLHASRLVNIKPEEAIYVGDTLADINAAKAANMPLVLACYGFLPDYQLLKRDVANCIDSPIELIEIIK